MAKFPIVLPKAWSEAPPTPPNRAGKAKRAAANAKNGKAGAARSPWGRPEAMLAYNKAAAATALTGWDLLLKELGLTEAEALRVVRGEADGPGRELRGYAMLHYGRRFIPEQMLASLGLSLDEDRVVAGRAYALTREVK